MSRVGIVLVSHSPALAEAALQLALAMVPRDSPTVVLAAGTADGRLGSDPLQVAAAIATADSGAGVVLLSDLGSSVINAEMALEFCDPIHQTAVVAAPFVEGLVAALVCAAGGAPLAVVAKAAREALAPKLAQLAPQGPAADESAARPPQEASPEARASITVVNAGGMHARPAAEIAALVAPLRASISLANARGDRADAASPIALGLLAAAPGDQLTLTAAGEDAERALELLSAAFAAGFGEECLPLASAIPSRGVGVSPGRVCGPVRSIEAGTTPPAPSPPLPLPQRAEAAAQLDEAIQAEVAELRQRARGVDGARGALLTALAALAADASLHKAARRAVIEQGQPAEAAWWTAVTAIAASYRAAGGRTAERASDLLELRDRVLQRLVGPRPEPPLEAVPSIWLAHEPGPLELAALGGEACLGLVMECGGPNCHAAILARELGIPAVSGARGILGLRDGTRLLVDGSTGELVLNPDLQPDPVPEVTSRQPSRPQRLTSGGLTLDGQPIALLANVSGIVDNQAAAASGAEGVGLLRTELCFPQFSREPSLAEQIELYTTILAAWPGRRVLIRTLDSGADKPLPYLISEREPNPALGLRGIRSARRHPEVLERQLQAIASAALHSEADVGVMAPMISTVAEAAAFVQQARAAGLSRVGVMLETPAAALCAEALCGVVDFVSIGSNDLLQYTMATDRACAELADLTTPWQPALLRLIAMIAEAARHHGIPVGLCGEAASCTDLAPVLVGLGVSSLSMAAGRLAAVAAAVKSVSLNTARRMAAAALACGTAEEAALAAARAAEL